MRYRWPLDPLRDRQQDPSYPCEACGGEVYGVVLGEAVLCAYCERLWGTCERI